MTNYSVFSNGKLDGVQYFTNDYFANDVLLKVGDTLGSEVNHQDKYLMRKHFDKGVYLINCSLLLNIGSGPQSIDRVDWNWRFLQPIYDVVITNQGSEFSFLYTNPNDNPNNTFDIRVDSPNYNTQIYGINWVFNALKLSNLA